MNQKQVNIRIDISKIIDSKCSIKKVENSSALIEILNSHNLRLSTDSEIKSYICENGYYFMSGYRRVFLDSFLSGSWAGKYNDGVSEQWLLFLIRFDKEIGVLVLRYCNIIERRLKSRAAYFLSKETSEDMHLFVNNFESLKYWEDTFSEKYKQVLISGQRDQNPIIRHHLRHYDGRLPIWVFFEHISFGDFIQFMSNLKLPIKNQTFDDIFHSKSIKYPIRDYMSAAPILDMLTIVKMVRNRIAHLGRIYDWQFHYRIGKKSFTKEYSLLFDPTKDDFLFNDIVDIFGFFLPLDLHDQLVNEIRIIIQAICEKIPNPYSDRILSLMGYRKP
jgi:abortive infection bacteriophage resistance protein